MDPEKALVLSRLLGFTSIAQLLKMLVLLV